ncbi:MAG: tRNA lysidine(34) synthetase TilS, partial [Candidatus Binataceae bacterium]
LKDRFDCRLVAAHLNHRLRAAESDRDESFVRELCAHLGIDLIVEHARDLRAGSANLEERARELRYAFFDRVADALGASHIALAHQADDQAETVLMRLLRGSGVAGLAAMDEAGPGRLIRPLLPLRRAEILAYLDAIGAAYVTDSSNLSSAPVRNRIRNQLIPLLEDEYAPRLTRRLAGLSAEMRALDNFISGAARREVIARLGCCAAADGRARLELTGFAQLHPALQPAVIREFVRAATGSLRRFERGHIDALVHLCVDGPPNGGASLPGRLAVRREYRWLTLEKPAPREGKPSGARHPFAVSLPSEGEILVEEACFAFRSRIVQCSEGWKPANLFEMAGDMEGLAGGLMVRGFRPGDRVSPLNLAGIRKVKNVFIDRKLPLRCRATWPLVTIVGGDIVWIPGMVRSNLATVTAATRQILRVVAQPLERARKVSLLGN